MAESTFQLDVFRVRLRQLNSSQNSIQTMSMWIAHHHQSVDQIAKTWSQELCKNDRGSPDWMVAMFYVANDVIQNSRKNKTPLVVKEFFPALRSAIEHLGRNKQQLQEKVSTAIQRVIQILGERTIYPQKQIDELKTAFSGTSKIEMDEDALALRKYETNIEDRMKIRKKAFGEAIDNIKILLNPPSADSTTRQLIATYPEQIADSKNICPSTISDAKVLFEKTSEAHDIVDKYAKKVKLEKARTKDLHKQLIYLNSLLDIESKLGKELLEKGRSCLQLLERKQIKLKNQKDLLPDEPTESDYLMPESVLDDL